MNPENAKSLVYELFKRELRQDRKKKGYICPICGSGSGKNGTGITENPNNPGHFSCWAGCFKNWDAFDIIAFQNGVPRGSPEALKFAYNKFGISVDSKKNGHLKGEKSSEKWPFFSPILGKSPDPPCLSSFLTAENGVEIGAVEMLRLAQENFIGSPGEEYMRGRGISSETAGMYQLGYSPSLYFAADQQRHPAVIIPSGLSFYTARNIGEGARYANPKGERATLFNGKVLENQQGRPVFITEGAIDALSILEVGGLAVALNSAANYDLILAKFREQKSLPPVVLCFDSDEAGKKAGEAIKAVLDEIGGAYMDGRAVLCGAHDVNDALCLGRDRFQQAVRTAERDALEIVPAASAEYRNQNAFGYLGELSAEIARNANEPRICTGFQILDSVLGGGLYAGLYFLGAVSSVGKTTFALQLCDQAAAAGQDVIVFSLEMARTELMAKSISRLTCQLADAAGLSWRSAKSTRGILDGSRWKGYSAEERLLISEGFDKYSSEIAPRVWIVESVGAFGTEEVRAAVKKHIMLTGNRPVCVVDYVQIMEPADVRATDKQNTDRAVRELKRISRDFSVPVIAISSLNRESYADPISTRAFKESGAIEYGCDVLLGLQYDGMDYVKGENEKDRRVRVRELAEANERAAAVGQGVRMQLKVLKQRSGKRGVSVYFTYYPVFNLFTELDGPKGDKLGGDGQEDEEDV